MQKLLGLQYLRALAATAVVVLHAGRTGWNFHAGEAGVDLFFLLSGFLMVAITGPTTRPLSFLADRARRIVPPYWIATLVVLAGALAGAFPRLRLEGGHVLASFLFIPWRSPSDGHAWPLLVPGWTLNDEMFFYLLFAVLMPLGNQRRQLIALTGLLSAAVALGLVFRPSGALAATWTDPMLLEFAAGGWLGLVWLAPGAWPRWLGMGTAAVALATVLVTAAILPTSWRLIIYGLPAALLLASLLAMEQRRAVPVWRLPLFIGDASYSIYLWHTLAVSMVLTLCGRLGIPPVAATIIGVIGGLAIGVAAFLVTERPMLRFFRERRYMGGVPVPAGP